MAKVIFFILMIFFLPQCRSQDRKLLEMELVLDRLDSAEEFVVKMKINNRSSQNFYLVRLSPISNMHFISHDNHDISKEVWDDFFYSLEVPEPPDSILTDRSKDSHELFFNCALNEELNEIELVNLDSISEKQKKDLIDLISIKYELVTLVKRESSYEDEYTFHLNSDSLKSIVFSYDYSNIFQDVDEEFLYETTEGVFIVKNLPLENVCGYSLFQGKLNAKIEP